MKYSIIIPTIGRETLSQVIEGIRACEDFDKINLEILVVFDGKQLIKLDFQDIKILETKQKVYAGGARNLGIDESTGDVLVFIGDNGIPDKFWLSKIVAFHEKFPEQNIALLGKIEWKEKTDFTNFLENKAQFNFKKISKSGANWKHFYTSNLSLKKEFLGNKRFSDRFEGWGFEDSELGYRLEQNGISLVFDENIKIFRTDNPGITDVIEKTKSSRKNAKIFEFLHPEVKVLPSGCKKLVLHILIFFAGLLSLFSKKIKWWYLWKKNWIS